MKSYTLTQMKEKYIGKLGTAERDNYERALNIEVQEKSAKEKNQVSLSIPTPPNPAIKK